MLQINMLMPLMLRSTFNRTDIKIVLKIWDHRKWKVTKFLENFLFFQPYNSSEKDCIIICLNTGTQHSAWLLLKEEIVLQPSVIKLLASMLEGNCILICKLTMCSSLMNIFLWMWLKKVWWYGLKTSDRMCPKWNICLCPERNNFVCQFNKP